MSLREIVFVLCLFTSHALLSQNFSIVYPKNNQVVTDFVELSWNEQSNASTYIVQISAQENFSNSLSFNCNSTIRLLNTATLTFKSCYWRVIAKQNGVSIDTTNQAKFEVFLPSEIDSLNLWLKADALIKDSVTNNVVKWLDLSDSNVNVTQNTVSSQPSWNDSVINNHPAVYFNSNLEQFVFNMDMDTPNFTLASVYNTNEEVFRGIRMISGFNNWFIGPYNDRYRAFAGSFTPSSPIKIGDFVNHTAHVVNDTLYNYVNGDNLGSAFSTNQPGAGWRLGQRLNGYVAELIIVNGTLNDSLVQLINTYLMDKYAPPVNLGADRRVCHFPDTLSLGIDYALDYTWSTGDTTDAIQVDSGGKYYVTITDMFERTSVDSIWYILDTSNYQVDFGFTDSTICLGESIQLVAGKERFSYQWSTLDTTNSIVVKTPGNIKVTVKNCLGNFSTDSVTINLNEPRFDLGEDSTGCFNQAVLLRPDSNFANVSYNWSTGATSNSIVADTTRTYTLKVIDSFGCTFSDSITIAIDSSLFGTTLGPDTALCEGNFIGLQNLDSSKVSYLWSTGNLNPYQLIDTAGTYSVEVNRNQCSISDTINITIQGLAPTASFDASNFCFQDSVQFLDSSIAAAGDTLVSWLWDFNDGQTATQQKPKHYFDTVANFLVTLKVTTDKNCSDTVSQVIAIQPKPKANFGIDNLVTCSKEAIQFLDSSIISSGSITSYKWKFNDTTSAGDTAIVADPIYTFDTLGNYTINLIVASNKGCKDTISKNEFINPTPAVSFTYNGSCLNDSTYFTDRTVLPQGTIADFLWATNGQVSLKENPVFKYLSAGLKPVAFRVRTTAGCQSILRDTIELFENPKANFTSSLACLDDTLKLFDQSNSEDSIINYNYRFNNKASSLRNPTFIATQLGSFNVHLSVTSVNQCEDSISKMVKVNEVPEAAFSILNNRTGIPFQVALSNNSLRASTHKWDFGNGDLSIAEVPDYTYQDTGNYDLKLVVSSNAGCKDSLTKELIVLPSFLDALLERIILEENSIGELSVAAQIINLGNNTINSLNLSVDLNNQYQSKESFDETIYRGNSSILSFSNQFLVDEGQKLDFVCIKVEEVNGIEDDVLINNNACEKGFNNEVILKAYPNPTAEMLFLDYVLPQQGELKINVYDQLGRRVLDEISTNADEGFYQSRLNVNNLRPGIYYYKFSLNGEEINGAFLKR